MIERNSPSLEELVEAIVQPEPAIQHVVVEAKQHVLPKPVVFVEESIVVETRVPER